MMINKNKMSKLDRIEALEEQASCAAMGHEVSIVAINTTWGRRRFECLHCGVSYWRYDCELTKKEKALLAAFNMKG